MKQRSVTRLRMIFGFVDIEIGLDLGDCGLGAAVEMGVSTTSAAGADGSLREANRSKSDLTDERIGMIDYYAVLEPACQDPC